MNLSNFDPNEFDWEDEEQIESRHPLILPPPPTEEEIFEEFSDLREISAAEGKEAMIRTANDGHDKSAWELAGRMSGFISKMSHRRLHDRSTLRRMEAHLRLCQGQPAFFDGDFQYFVVLDRNEDGRWMDKQPTRNGNGCLVPTFEIAVSPRLQCHAPNDSNIDILTSLDRAASRVTETINRQEEVQLFEVLSVSLEFNARKHIYSPLDGAEKTRIILMHPKPCRDVLDAACTVKSVSDDAEIIHTPYCPPNKTLCVTGEVFENVVMPIRQDITVLPDGDYSKNENQISFLIFEEIGMANLRPHESFYLIHDDTESEFRGEPF